MSVADIARLFDEHHESLFRYLLRLTGDADLAHDAAQEAFTRYVQKPPRNEHTRAWLFTVATNVVRSGANRERRRSQILAAGAARTPVADPGPDPEQAAISTELRDLVRAALDSLPERERTILLMREEGFTHREIAQAVNTTTGSVGTMIARALDRLAAALPLDLQEAP